MGRIILALCTLLIGQLTIQAQSTLDLYPNLETIGVHVNLQVADLEGDASAELWYGTNSDNLKKGLALDKDYGSNTRLSGVILWCYESTKYIVKIVIRDPTTPELDGEELQGSVETRNTIFKEPNKYLYVSPNGSGNEFTQQNPGEILNALSQRNSGEGIYLLEGEYFMGNWVISEQADAENSLIIRGEDKKNVILNGAQTNSLNWKQVGQDSTLYVTTTQEVNPNLVLVNGERAYPFRTLDELTNNKINIGIKTDLTVVSFPANITGFFRNPSTNPLCNERWQYPKTLYLKLKSGLSFDPEAITISAERFGIRLENSAYVKISNISFKNYGLSPVGGALSIDDSHNILIENCAFGVNDVGIILKDSSTNISIVKSTFYDSMFHWSAWKMKMTYDQVWPYTCMFPSLSRMLERGGLIYAHGFNGRGIVLSHNEFRDFAQAGHGCPPSVNTNYHKSYDIDISNNVFKRCFEDGLEVDADARSIRIWGNTFEQINAPISLAVAQNGPVYILRNVFRNLKSDTFTIHPDQGLLVAPGHTFKTNYGSPEHSGVIHFYHNTIDAGEGHIPVDLISPGNWHKYIIKNNIFTTGGQYLLKYHTSEYLDLDMNHNVWYDWNENPSFSVDTSYQDAIPKTIDNTLKTLRGFGWSLNDTIGNPWFENRELGDYQIHGSGPAFDRGIVITGINDRFENPFPDIGAFEYYWGSSQKDIVRNSIFYPNPSSGKICWKTKPVKELQNVTIFDVQGRIVYKESTLNNCIEMASIKGMCVIQIVRGEQIERGKVFLE